MIKSMKVTNYLGVSLDFDLTNPVPSGFAILSIDGLGPVKADINVTDIASFDGALYNSSRVGKRNIVMKFRFFPHPTIEDTRLLSYKMFPVKKQVTILLETDNRLASVTGYVESNEPDIFSENEGCQVSIICPDPYFYSEGEDGTTEIVFSSSEPAFEFPFSNESLEEKLITFGIIKIYNERTLYYKGDTETGVTITLHATGQVDNVKIYNTKTAEFINIDTTKLQELTGSGIIAGDTITICTLKGKKSITLLRNSETTNILNCIDKNSTWFQLAKGDNLFAYSATYGATNLQIRISSQTIYEGV